MQQLTKQLASGLGAALCMASAMAQTPPATPAQPKMQCFIGSSTATTRCPAVLKHEHVSRQAARNPAALVGQKVAFKAVQQSDGALLFLQDPKLPLRFACPAGALPKADTIQGTINGFREHQGQLVITLDRCS